jgi:hypothetical protein
MPAHVLLELALLSIVVRIGSRGKTSKGSTSVPGFPRPARQCAFAVWMWTLRIEICAKALAYGNLRLAWGAISGVEVEKLSW